MSTKLKNIVVSMVALVFTALPVVALPSLAYAATTPNIKDNLCSGTNFDITGGSKSCDQNASTDNFQKLLTNIVNIFSAIVGVIAVVMIIVGGLRYITSGGDTGHVSTAKTTIIYALVGLVIVALAQLIVHFVLAQSQTVLGG